MSIEIYDPFPGDPGIFENCCLCRRETPFWNKANDVALCPECAATAEESDIPTKLDWILKEQLLDGM